jgi:hypothetical protein
MPQRVLLYLGVDFLRLDTIHLWIPNVVFLSTPLKADPKLNPWKLKLHYVLGSVRYYSKDEDLMAFDHRRKAKSLFTTSIQSVHHLVQTLPSLSSPMIFRRSRNQSFENIIMILSQSLITCKSKQQLTTSRGNGIQKLRNSGWSCKKILRSILSLSEGSPSSHSVVKGVLLELQRV